MFLKVVLDDFFVCIPRMSYVDATSWPQHGNPLLPPNALALIKVKGQKIESFKAELLFRWIAIQEASVHLTGK